MSYNGLVSRLAAIQEAHGWTDQQMAERLKISRVFWLNVKNGHRVPGHKFLRGAVSAFPGLAEEALKYLQEE